MKKFKTFLSFNNNNDEQEKVRIYASPKSEH